MEYSEYAKRKDWAPGNALQRWLATRILLNALKVQGSQPDTCKILDVGSGTGLLGQAAIQMGFKEYVAVEPNLDLANLTKMRTNGCHVHEARLPDLPESLDHQFDIVVAVHVIEHAKNGYEARNWIISLLKTLSPGGVLIIVSPHAPDYKMYFWDIDWSHGYPTSVNSLKQILLDLRADIRKNSIMRLGSTNFAVSSFGYILGVLIPTRLVNIIGRSIVGRELGTGMKSALLWGVTFVCASNTEES